jgi:AAA ATPase domain/AAA domain
MLARLTLRRFRGFTDLTAPLRPVTVIMGPNSSGKTSLLHAIRIAHEALTRGLDEASPQLDRSHDGRIHVCRNLLVNDHASLMPVHTWDEMFTDRETGQGITATIDLDYTPDSIIRALSVELGYARNNQLKISVWVESPEIYGAIASELPKRSHRRLAILEGLVLGTIPRVVFVPAFYGVTRNEEYRTRALVERSLGGGDQSRIVRNLIAQLSGTAFDKLNDFLRRSVGARIERRSVAAEAEALTVLTVYFRDTNGTLELASAGAGLINLVALYATMERLRPLGGDTRRVIYLLDEPEAHLHPRLQGDVGKALADLTTEFGAQLVVATHSIEMINRLGQRDDTQLLAVDRATSTATPLDDESALIRELSAWCDLTPFTAINFLASRRILLHEGPSDSTILTSCARLYFRNDTTRSSEFARWTMESLNGAGNISARAVLKTVLSPALFPDLSVNKPVQAVCVLDRDLERTAGLHGIAELSKKHFTAHQLVWSRYSIESLFLEPECLAGWLGLAIDSGDVAPEVLAGWVREALAAADADQALNDEALTRLAAHHARTRQPAAGTKKPNVQVAVEEALARVRKEPGTWQNGKKRAAFVLGHVRQKLPKDLQNRVLKSIDMLVARGTSAQLGDPAVLIPPEIRTLLDHMARPPAPSP